jgi:oligoendopeptidase F
MHQEVERGRILTADWLDENYLRLTRHYYGHDQGVMSVNSFIANEWSGIPHFYYNFYVYQYSTGIIASTALAEMVISGGRNEGDRYMNFLKAGGSRYPLDILEQTGIDLRTPIPIQATINRFSELTEEMKRLAQKLKIAGRI